MAAREVVLVALLVFDHLGLLLAWLGRLVMLLVLLVLVLLVLRVLLVLLGGDLGCRHAGKFDPAWPKIC